MTSFADRLLSCARRPRMRTVAGLSAAAAAGAAALWLAFPLPVHKLNRYPASLHILDRRGNCLRVVLDEADVLCDPIDVRDTGDWAANALVAAEDKRFWRHPGVDMIAIARAAALNVICRRVVSGASTLSTQVIRLTTPRRRTLGTKFIEAFRALQLEHCLSKEEILTQYLNRAPFGGNIIGIQAASRRYFGKDARELSLGEASLLVGLPQSPSRYRPDRHLARARKRRTYVLGRLASLDVIDPATARRIDRDGVDVNIHPLPFSAPHFCDLVLQQGTQTPDPVATNHLNRITTTLDPELQRAAAGEMAQHAARLREAGVWGGSVVIMEVSSGAVRALVGSPDYDDPQHAGQVNGATCSRSPGSALKPFAYAMAFDRGLLTPETVLGDVPMHFDDYDPQNYGRTFTGLVTVRQALVQSLNIPALKTVERLSQPCFVGSLRELGLDTVAQPASHYGLSVVLGTAEVRLLDLVNAYACLARSGLYRPYILTETGADGTTDAKAGTRLFSEAAAYLVADILGGDERSLAAGRHIADVRMPRVAWKTGTSNGLRDAWAIGYNPEYVVGIWLGNPDGSPSDALVGLASAAPLLLDVFRRIYPGGNAPWFERPAAVRTRAVCALSGQPLGYLCPRAAEGAAIEGVSDPRPCCVHRRALGSHDAATQEIWPPEIASFLRARGMASEAPKQAEAVRVNRVRIVSPIDGARYRYIPGMDPDIQRLDLRAICAVDTDLFWVIDGTCAGQTRSDAPLPWRLATGRHTITCTDAAGYAATVAIVVD